MRGYFIGFHDGPYVSSLFDIRGERIVGQKIEAPFESPLFRGGDALFEVIVSGRLSELIGKGAEHLVYNKTTGRLVVLGSPGAHRYLKTYALRLANDEPRTLEAHLRFYRVAVPGLLKGELSEKLIVGEKPVAEVVLKNRPSQEAVFQIGEPDLRVTWDPNISPSDDDIDTRIAMEGEMLGQSFSIETLFTSFDSEPVMIELGKIGGNEESLFLWMKQEILFGDGLSRLNLILDGDGQPISIPIRTGKPSPPFDSLFFNEGVELWEFLEPMKAVLRHPMKVRQVVYHRTR